MSKDTESSLFMFPPKALKYVGLYQQLLRGTVDYERLGNKLVMLSEQARAFRQFDQLSEYALILSNLPLKTYQSIGQYYLALSLCRNGRGELDKARTILETVASNAPLKYRAEAMVTLSSVSWDLDRSDDTLRYRMEAIRISGFSETTVKALRGIAILKSFEGFHKSALRDLENMYPIVKYAPPHIYFDYLNSLAIELAECGRLYEARNVSNIVCGSPLVSVYPEWQATAEDLRGANRSFVVIDPGRAQPKNVLLLPPLERDGIEFPIWAGQPGQVINYEQRKKRMAKKKKNGDKRKPIDEMNEKELIYEILHLFTSDKVTYEQRVKILQYAEKVLTEPKKPDDDKPGA